MGTRTLFQVADSDQVLIATLFANSSHETQFAEAVFVDAIRSAKNRYGPNALIETLLSLRYDTDEGNHSTGDRIFWLVPTGELECGDWEVLVKVTHRGAGEELLTKGYATLDGEAWFLERQELDS